VMSIRMALSSVGLAAGKHPECAQAHARSVELAAAWTADE
jgi:hypothetical protein